MTDLWWRLRTSATAKVVSLLLVALCGLGSWFVVQFSTPQRFDQLVLDPVASAGGITVAAPRMASTAPSSGGDTRAAAPTPATEAPPTPPGPQVWLLVSSGTGDLDAGEADYMGMPDGTSRAGDRLTDAIMLLVVDPTTHRSALLSIPRDAWMFDRGHRINASWAKHGMQALVDDVRQLTGLPVHRVVGVNMRGFVRAVDAVDGVTVATDRTLRDSYSHLPALPAGCWTLDGPDALAYVRSRHTETLRDGVWRNDRTASDFGRTGRQREVLGSVWDRLRGPRLVGAVPALLRVVGQDLTLDRGAGLAEVVDLARSAQDVAAGDVEQHLLPTTGRTIAGAAAQVVDEDAAGPILARLAAWPAVVADRAPAPDVAPNATAGPTPTTTTRPAASADTPAADPDEESTSVPDEAPQADVDTLDPATCAPSPTPWRD